MYRERSVCGNCKGSGVDRSDQGRELGIPCPACKGRKVCSACGGKGKVPAVPEAAYAPVTSSENGSLTDSEK